MSEACANAIDAQRAIDADGTGGDPHRARRGRRWPSPSPTTPAGSRPTSVDPLPSVEDPGRLRHEHGLGLPLMRSLSESVTFRATDDGTAVRIEVGTVGRSGGSGRYGGGRGSGGTIVRSACHRIATVVT